MHAYNVLDFITLIYIGCGVLFELYLCIQLVMMLTEHNPPDEG